MRVTSVAVLSMLSMLASSLLVLWMTPPPSIARAAPAAASGAARIAAQLDLPGAIGLDVRVGHRALARGGSRETYLLATARAPSGARRSKPLDVAILIDRSGSMRGRRLDNALAAARGMIDRLADDDRVRVITYDTRVSTLLSARRVDASTRRAAARDLASVAASGNTCISCALEAGIGLLEADGPSDSVKQILLLSDGEPTAGVRGLPGFERLARRARRADIAISSLGVDVDYNEELLAMLARQSNGRHHFVREAGDLERAFAAELAALGGAVASGATLTVRLARGVELVKVFDREVDRDGPRVLSRLGTFSAGDVKTLLVQVRLPAGAASSAAVAEVALDYRADRPTHVEGSVGVRIVETAAPSALDPVVAERLGRSRTGALLLDADELFKSGEPADFSALDRRFASQLAELDALGERPDVARQKTALESARHTLRAARAGSCGCSPADLPVRHALQRAGARFQRGEGGGQVGGLLRQPVSRVKPSGSVLGGP